MPNEQAESALTYQWSATDDLLLYFDSQATPGLICFDQFEAQVLGWEATMPDDSVERMAGVSVLRKVGGELPSRVGAWISAPSAPAHIDIGYRPSTDFYIGELEIVHNGLTEPSEARDVRATPHLRRSLGRVAAENEANFPEEILTPMLGGAITRACLEGIGKLEHDGNTAYQIVRLLKDRLARTYTVRKYRRSIGDYNLYAIRSIPKLGPHVPQPAPGAIDHLVPLRVKIVPANTAKGLVAQQFVVRNPNDPLNCGTLETFPDGSVYKGDPVNIEAADRLAQLLAMISVKAKPLNR